MNVIDNEAAPYIRRMMCEYAIEADQARLKRDRTMKLYMFMGLATALDILTKAVDTREHVAPGIAGEDTLPAGAVVLARHHLGYSADNLFGEESRRRCALEHDSHPTGRCTWWADDDSAYCRAHRMYMTEPVAETDQAAVIPAVIPNIPKGATRSDA